MQWSRCVFLETYKGYVLLEVQITDAKTNCFGKPFTGIAEKCDQPAEIIIQLYAFVLNQTYAVDRNWQTLNRLCTRAVLHVGKRVRLFDAMLSCRQIPD